MVAIYFDGKSSKPHKVSITESGDGLRIISEEGGPINAFWKREEIRTESFSTGNKILLSYGEFPFERLELTGDSVDGFMKDVLQNESFVKKYQHTITRASPVKLVLGSIAVLAAVIYSYVFHISPYVGEQAVKIVPISVETKVGEIMYNNMSYIIDKDSVKSDLLLEFFNACGFESDYDIRMDYSSNSMVNAFAVPGGQIVVFEGLIRETECWDELAALMGHELAHVNERHSFKQLARSVTGYLLLSVLTGDVAGVSSVIIENASAINDMANSRKHEKEADVVGLDYLKASKIRPQAMMDLFSRLMEGTDEDEVTETLGTSMEYLSTHPLTSNRISYIQDLIDSDDSFDYPHADIPRAREVWEELKDEAIEPIELKVIKKIKEKILGQDDDEEAEELEEELIEEELTEEKEDH